MTDAKTADAKTYQGGCHCGRVRYEVTGDFSQGFDCNCSICMKRGALWGFVKAPQFKLLQGDDALTDYQFGKKKIHHLFCQSCGVGSFSRGLAPNGDETFAINLNCIDDIDVAALKQTPFDGKNL
jgi:hypothetical protein